MLVKNCLSLSVLRWRTKQILDFSFLMLYAQEKGTYYVQVGVKGQFPDPDVDAE